MTGPQAAAVYRAQFMAFKIIVEDKGMSPMRTNQKIACLVGMALALTATTAAADYIYNLPRGVTEISHDMYELHMLIFWICVGIGVVVFGVMLYAIIRHRRSRGQQASHFHGNTSIEIIWTIVPFVILVAMAIPATQVLIAMEDTGDSDMTIEITGYQWQWHYDYLDQDISFNSTMSTPRTEIYNQAAKNKHYMVQVDKPMVVPVGKKIRVLITSGDVIHSWWVNDLGVKQDAIPGFINAKWFQVDKPGIYRGHCAELCGRDHAYMPVVVRAVPPKDFNRWVKIKQGVEKEQVLVTEGKDLYATHCSTCHQPDGEGVPGVYPSLKGSAVVAGPVSQHISIVENGVPGTAMPAFGPQLTDAEIAAIVSYERRAFGKSKKAVQPKQVRAAL
jgi:cytochrome c oxidase subunit 2